MAQRPCPIDEMPRGPGEDWRHIPGWGETYAVSSHGRVARAELAAILAALPPASALPEAALPAVRRWETWLGRRTSRCRPSG